MVHESGRNMLQRWKKFMSRKKVLNYGPQAKIIIWRISKKVD
jgi:hypothetical protein